MAYGVIVAVEGFAMYKLLLCLRYLKTRYIALASVVSVTLGVATMIVVNSVMEGFTREMQARIHGILADVVFESHNLEGFGDPQAHMDRIREIAGPYIAGMTPTVAVPAQLAFDVGGHRHTLHVSLIGVDPESYGQVSDFTRYLKHPANRRRLGFELRDGGYDAVDAGWPHRRRVAQRAKENPPEAAPPPAPLPPVAAEPAPPPETMVHRGWKYTRARRAVEPENLRRADHRRPAVNPFMAGSSPAAFDPARDAHTGIVLGIGLARFEGPDGGDRYLVRPGDDVKITVPTAGTPPKAASDTFTIVDFYESEMNEYDANFIFVSLEELQNMRGMIDPQSGVRYVTSIQIKLHDEADGPLVRDLLRSEFPRAHYGVLTWRDKQGPLLAAVGMQTAILNVLLFLIIAVAGFGILAIFYMIVAEKTRDIGILKSLGAPGSGIQGIFLAYGLSLGVVGSGAGLVIGLLIVANINRVAEVLAWISGHDVFDPTIYYFQEIPTIVEPLTVCWIVGGAMLIAVSASIAPARRAARLHPVEALRHE
jgi:lipoprotein-releasing system permease protein